MPAEVFRYGRDPQMRMEAEGEAAAAGAAADASGEIGAEAAGQVVETTQPPADAAAEDISKWTLEDAVAKVKETRQEAAKYRTRAQKFETAFSDLDEATTEGMLGLVAALKAGDPAAIPVLESIMAELSPKEQEDLKDALAEGETAKTLTPEEVEARVREAIEKDKADDATKRAADEAYTTMKTEIEGLGYSLDDTKPNAQTSLLFFFLGQQSKDAAPDIKAAHKQVEDFRQSVIDGFKESVNEKNSRFARIAAAGATPNGADGGKKKLSLADGSAGKAALEFLEASAGS